jgi:ribosome biogenesis GTPase
LPSGIILKGVGGFYYVSAVDQVYACKARGIFRKMGITPLPGDRVDFSITHIDKKEGFLEKIHERRTCLERPAVSNVSMLLAVVSVKDPEPDLELLDKLLVTAEKEGVSAIICVNKVDLDDDKLFKRIKGEYNLAKYTVIATSGLDGTGIGDLKQALSNNISVLAGQSGVGKSTLINAIVGSAVMDTGEVSRKAGRGKHTTRHAQLLEVKKGCYVVDTPGFSSFDLNDYDISTLQCYYPEFESLTLKCRFRGCIHICEPDCAVWDAAAKGLISPGRYKRYVELCRKLESDRRRRYD